MLCGQTNKRKIIIIAGALNISIVDFGIYDFGAVATTTTTTTIIMVESNNHKTT